MGARLIPGGSIMKNEAILDGQFSPFELVAISMTLLVAACSVPGAAIDPEAQARATVARPAPPDEHAFPPIESAKLKQGTFPSIEALRRMSTGMGKDQVRSLLSHPHFNEGLLDVREWNYIFHFRTGDGPAYITCQYMVRFNEEMLSTGTYWKSPQCEAMAKRSRARPVVKPVVVAPSAPSLPQKITLAADGLFLNDGASEADLLPEGRRKVELLGVEIRHKFRSLKSIAITGHTDRLGPDERNDTLSLARANTVRDLLVRQGIDPALIRTAAAGRKQPVTQCLGLPMTSALASCLQPRRRVEVEVTGDQ
jgi:outer membrane protein OmpA-like peptidoglycan-associated protein